MRLLEGGVPVHQVANQLGDTVETIVRSYVKPAIPTQDSVDAAYGVYRKCTENMEEMAGFAAAEDALQTQPNAQISALTQGFSANPL